MLETDFAKISDQDINSGDYVFRDVFDIYKYIKYKGWNIGWYAAPYFEVMELEKGHVVASPTPFQPLYRGQSSYYEPCLPSLYRKQWTIEQTLERLVQLEDFKSILNEHPEIQDTLRAGLYVNYDGLAQHYGIETSIMDLTNSFGVAAYFATSDYDALTGSYRPVMEIVRKGVIYFLPMGIFGEIYTKRNQVWPIGMEALPRPGEQRGFGAYLKPEQDFHSLRPFRFFFWQNSEASIECHKRMGFGQALFPYDPMVEKVWSMRKYRVYGLDSVEKVVRTHPELNLELDSAVDMLVRNGCNILPMTPFRYTKQELEFITQRYHDKYSNGFEK